ncbi:MAG: adenosylmethionine--8-amino-7-oxononanoate transaminase [Candidatus Omnitrophota bacterium]
MRKGIFITGTDTEIGKTFIGAAIAYGLKKKGIDCGVMKPIQSGAIKKDGKLISQDAEFLVRASDARDELSLINPYCFKVPLAPSVAAKIERRIISPKKIINAFNVLSARHQFMIVEGAGGLLVPISDGYLMKDLVLDLNLPILIISRLGLGTINHTLLTIEAARNLGIKNVGIIFNQIEDKPLTICEKTNPKIISNLTGVPILGAISHIPKIDAKRIRLNILEDVVKKIDLSSILNENGTADKNYLKVWDRKYIWHPFTQMKDYEKAEPLVIEEGKGSYLKDIDGRWYLDGVSSLWVNVHGHRNERLNRVVREQLNKIAHSTLLGVGNEPSIELAKRLIGIAPRGLTKVFYSDNGSTAVEIALKMAFQYWQQKGKKEKVKFITFVNAYHGDTIGSVSVGGIDLFHKIYKPLLFKSIKVNAPYCYRCHLSLTYPKCKIRCLREIERTMRRYHNHVAALIIEPLIQAAAGMITQPKGFIRRLRKLCDRYGILLILDEVATGFGRTGRMFACEHENVTPDFLCLAKSITGGYLPLAATLTTDEVYSGFLGDYSEKKTFFHGHTYSGNPLACKVAIANLEIFKKEKTLRKLQPKIEFLKNNLRRFYDLDHVGDIRQQGMMTGIELVKNESTKEPYKWEDRTGWKVIEELRKHGIILRPLGPVIVLMPPLNISIKDLRFLLRTTYNAIGTVLMPKLKVSPYPQGKGHFPD